jgi:hypothetical protein
MSTRSDVFVAIKADLWDSVKDLSIWKSADVAGISDDGDHGFQFDDISWSPAYDEHLKELYSRLSQHDPSGDGHLIIEACHDYPESDDGDHGRWTSNPWGAYRQISVSIVSSLYCFQSRSLGS